jgi:hypothetical protein
MVIVIRQKSQIWGGFKKTKPLYLGFWPKLGGGRGLGNFQSNHVNESIIVNDLINILILHARETMLGKITFQIPLRTPQRPQPVHTL